MAAHHRSLSVDNHWSRDHCSVSAAVASTYPVHTVTRSSGGLEEKNIEDAKMAPPWNSAF